jgi:hypothetical protein
MRTSLAHYLHAFWCSLRRRPVLSTMMVYSVGFGAFALIATLAVWRSTSACPTLRKPAHLYLVRIVPEHRALVS